MAVDFSARLDEGASDSDASEYTFSSLTVDGANDYVVAIGSHLAAASIGTIAFTLGGQSGTNRIQLLNPGGGLDSAAAIGTVVLTTGSTADLVVTPAEGWASCGVALYTITGHDSLTPSATASDEDDDNGADVSLNTDDDGGVLAMRQCTGGSAITWSGITGDLSQDLESAEIMETALVEVTTGETPRSITTDAGGKTAAVAAHWAPSAGGAAANPKGPFGMPFHGPFGGPIG